MKQHELAAGFFREIVGDPCMTPSHVSLYLALLQCRVWRGDTSPVLIHRREVMEMARVSRTTYQKNMQELQARGYIRYAPSYNHFQGSLVYFHGFPQLVVTIKITRYAILCITRQQPARR